MLTEIGYVAGGAVASLGGVALMFRFLNAKIDKKQDKSLCENLAKNFNKGLHRGEEKFDKIMDALGEIKEDNSAIKQELKHFNGKT